MGNQSLDRCCSKDLQKELCATVNDIQTTECASMSHPMAKPQVQLNDYVRSLIDEGKTKRRIREIHSLKKQGVVTVQAPSL